MKKKYIFLLVMMLGIFLLGVSYAWFNFNQTGENQKLITGDLYLVLEEATDEIVFAGGKYNVKNENNWLRTSGLFLTMTPVYYSSDMSNCSEFTMMQDGSLGYTSVTNSAYGLRPVINLKSDTLMSGGDGTPTNPYIIE